jgi:AcrR family transcriptional regulator
MYIAINEGAGQPMKRSPVERAQNIKTLRESKRVERERQVLERSARLLVGGGKGRGKAAQKAASKTPRRIRGSLSRDEIVEAALEIITVDGVEALSMRRIADKLRCSVASPYAHFENQEEIMRVLIMNGERQLTSDLRAAQASTQDVYAQLDAIAHAYWHFASVNRELHRLMFSASGGKLYRKSFPTLPTSYRVFLETIRRGTTSGSIPYSRRAYPAIARTMWSWMYGLIVLDLNDMVRHAKGADPVREGIDFFTRMLKTGE